MRDDLDFTDVVGVVEATRYEELRLYEKYHIEKGYSWEQQRSGQLVTVGRLLDRPICIAPMVHTINGKRILFVEATSALVDWQMIEEWLIKNLPSSAFNGKYLNMTNACNFHNLVS